METNRDRRRYRNNEITVLERFENYIKYEEYKKKQIEELDYEEEKIENSVKEPIYREEIIYNFIKEHILSYYCEENIINTKNIRNHREYFLDYIKEQVFLKLIIQRKNNNKNGLSDAASFRKIGSKYLQEKYLEHAEWDDDYYRKRYSELNKNRINKYVDQLKSFPEAIHFLNIYNYRDSVDKKFINEKFLNIIKDVTVSEIREYGLNDLMEFYKEFCYFINISKKKKYAFIRNSIFERLFKGVRLYSTFEKIKRKKNKKITRRKLIVLYAVLEMDDLVLSKRYIKKVLKKNAQLKEIYIIALLYKKIYKLIDELIDILLKNNNIDFNEYDNICYDEDINEELDGVEKSKERYWNITKEEEDIFGELKKLKKFFAENKMIQKLNNKRTDLLFYKDFERFKEIKL